MSTKPDLLALDALKAFVADWDAPASDSGIGQSVYDKAVIAIAALEAAQSQPVGINGLTDSETSQSASVMGLTAAQPVGVPAGMKLVPIEPTMEMKHAALAESRRSVAHGMTPMLTYCREIWASEEVYRAMLAASPEYKS